MVMTYGRSYECTISNAHGMVGKALAYESDTSDLKKNKHFKPCHLLAILSWERYFSPWDLGFCICSMGINIYVFFMWKKVY